MLVYTLSTSSTDTMPNVAMVRAAPRRKAKKAPRPAVIAVMQPSRALPKLSGRGAYTYAKPGPWGRVGRAVGGLVGAKYGGPLGSAVGSKLGSYAHYIGRIFGSGDYVTNAEQVKHNTLVNDAQVPSFASGRNVVKIRHREFLGDVISSATAGAFRITNYAINPGLPQSFPWLANVCSASFQQYRINGMVFEFRSMSADALNSTNTALGSVVMATDYDSKDVAFTSKQQMENSEFGVSCKPSSCMIHGIECARTQTSVSEQYIRGFEVPSGADIRLYDMGRFSIATVGCQGTSVNLGELWVSYDIDFFKAIEQVPNYSAPCAVINLGLSSKDTDPLGTAALRTVQIDEIGLTFAAGNNDLQFPSNIQVGSVYSLDYYQSGASTAMTIGTAVTVSNGFTAIWNTNTASSTGQRYFQRLVVRYTGGGTPALPPTVTYPDNTYIATQIQCNLKVYQIGGTMPDTINN